MGSEWTTETFAGIAAPEPNSLTGGPFGSNLGRADYKDSGVPVIRGTNIASNGRFTFDGFVFVSEEKADQLESCNAYPGDLIVTQRGTLGQVGRIPFESPYPRFVVSQSQMRLKCDESKVDPVYVYYFLKSSKMAEYFENRAIVTGVPHINLTILREAPISFPVLKEQQRIAHILGTLDDKIELNRKMNSTLEVMARAIFKSWFIDFDPVRAKMDGRQPSGLDAETAALFPERLVDSELGLIPEGWEVGQLGKVMKKVSDGVNPTALPSNTPYIGLGDMPEGSLALDCWGVADDVSSRKYRFRRGQILFGRLRPYFHKVGIAPVDGISSTDIQIVTPINANWYAYVLCQISQKEFIDYCTNMSSGTRMPRVKWGDMQNYQTAIAPEGVAAALGRILQPLFSRMVENVHENQALSASRDALLPELMGGRCLNALTPSLNEN